MKKEQQLEMPFIRTAHNYDRNEASEKSGLECTDKTLTKQSFLDETDINKIVERFGLTGEMPKDVRAPEYGDFNGINDYHTAVNALAKANEAFDEMPAKVRARFNNDTGAFVNFCSDENNRAEMKKMGLLKAELEADLKAQEKAPEAPKMKPGGRREGEVPPKGADAPGVT